MGHPIVALRAQNATFSTPWGDHDGGRLARPPATAPTPTPAYILHRGDVTHAGLINARQAGRCAAGTSCGLDMPTSALRFDEPDLLAKLQTLPDRELDELKETAITPGDCFPAVPAAWQHRRV